MSILKRLKPKFWDHEDVAAGPYKHLFNFRRIWELAVLLTVGVTLIPMIALTLIGHKFTKNAIESEILLQMSRLVSNTRRTISFFIAERRSALDFVAQDNSPEALRDPKRLASILENLERGFGGFEDLGVIEQNGDQRTYAGPNKLQNVNYLNQGWYKDVLERGVYLSDVVLGFRKTPHLDIAVKHTLPGGSFYVLRAALDIGRFNDLLSQVHAGGLGDVFITNRMGILQTPSRRYGKVLEKMTLPVPEYSKESKVIETKTPDGERLILGYTYLPETPFILMIVKKKADLLGPWQKARSDIIWFLIASMTVILIVILGVATYLVQKIHVADQKRIMTLHQVEYQNKLASIGRLAAGAAHEINNPLAIINEKAGLIKDMFTLKKLYAEDQKLMGLVDSILTVVERCGRITKSLLNFACHIDVRVQPIDLGKIITNVITLLGRDAEIRSIVISVKVQEDIPQIESDQSHLQQIFLNLLNNAFEALSGGGRLEITVRREEGGFVSVTFMDDRQGIPREDLRRIFDPFFSTKGRKVGTGLGLPITYGLVQEIGGSIRVKSEFGKGTYFIIRLPLKMDKKENLGREFMALMREDLSQQNECLPGESGPKEG